MTLTAVPDSPTVPRSVVAVVLVKAAPVEHAGEVMPGWLMRAQGVDGSLRQLTARAYRPDIADGQAVAEGWSEDRALTVVWHEIRDDWAVGWIVPARDIDD